MMDELFDAIEKRRSIRRFKDRKIPEEILDRVMEAVRWAPSWANTQCWEMILVKEHGLKEELQKSLAPKNPAIPAMTAAPVIVAVCARMGEAGYYKGQVTTKFGDWFMYDTGLATQTLCLAAHGLGLGTVIVGLFDHDKARSVLKIPDGVELVSLIPMGYPDQDPPAPKRKQVTDFVYHDTYGKRK